VRELSPGRGAGLTLLRLVLGLAAGWVLAAVLAWLG
jgi:hypothetical protein